MLFGVRKLQGFPLHFNAHWLSDEGRQINVTQMVNFGRLIWGIKVVVQPLGWRRLPELQRMGGERCGYGKELERMNTYIT